MDSNVISFMSYNSTGLDKLKVDWINDLLETFDVDCFQVQEHFKAIKTIEQFFKTNFTKYESYVSKAVREDLNHVGRPKGGLAQLVCKSSKIKKERVASQSWRIQAQILHINGFKLLWVNVYFPTDPQTQQIDETELNAT